MRERKVLVATGRTPSYKGDYDNISGQMVRIRGRPNFPSALMPRISRPLAAEVEISMKESLHTTIPILFAEKLLRHIEGTQNDMAFLPRIYRCCL